MHFTADWFTPNIPVWSRLLAPLVGTNVQALEIGSHEGRSAVWLLQNVLTHPDARLTCVDPWPQPEFEGRFDANVEETGRSGQVRKLRGTSHDVLPSLSPDSMDLIYVDGSHEGRDVLHDAVLSWRLLRRGGMLIFDDYVWRGPCVHPPRPAIDAFLNLWADQLELRHQERQVAIQRR